MGNGIHEKREVGGRKVKTLDFNRFMADSLDLTAKHLKFNFLVI